MIKRFLSCLTVVVVAALVAQGCGGGVNVYTMDAKAKTGDLLVNNPGLQDDVAIQGGKSLYQEQLMVALVSCQSRTNDSHKVYYKFVWYDGDGFQLPAEGWKWYNFLGNESHQFNGTATAPRAVKCEFLLRNRSEDDHEN